MKIIDIILNESREAPLYHFAPEGAFFKILVTDTLIGRGGRIYFTRDYRRQFVPANITVGSWGFRVNQNLLHQRFGKKLKAGGQTTFSNKDRQAWLDDPANASEIERIRAGQQSYSRTHNGADTKDIVKGTVGQSKRWESEEHLNVDQVPNFHEYITGLVYAGGNTFGNLGHHDRNFEKRNPRKAEALDLLAQDLMVHFKGEAGFKRRDALIEYMTKFGIPFVYQQQDFDANAVKSRMIQIWRERKAERERRAKEDQTHWVAMRNVQGGGVSTTGPSNYITAAQQVLKDSPHKFPDGIVGMKNVSTDKTYWFNGAYKDPNSLPNVWMGSGMPPNLQQATA